ncbi:dinuclear metal center YbgI/SA1388 family protein [Kribbella antiqua]|uniref:GTP cyclohydrolase 1 type 2 homolog n=1 Tax=Kribbella antiqua TaxID=2512217 RepID=A0A4R2JD38_9ACTN|nr:dinuclear metal center YbgI/SA1388 family protein [Kribbella antiqua]
MTVAETYRRMWVAEEAGRPHRATHRRDTIVAGAPGGCPRHNPQLASVDPAALRGTRRAHRRVGGRGTENPTPSLALRLALHSAEHLLAAGRIHGSKLCKLTSVTPTLADVIAVLDRLYDPAWAESWDAVGLVTGDPDQPVRRILFAVDPMRAVVDEAISGEYDLLVTHHPLLLRGVNSVAATTPKGRVVHDLIRSGTALHVCHTNADNANPGVSDALAAAVGLQDTRPLKPLVSNPELGGGRIGTLTAPEPLKDFARRVAENLPSTEHGVRVSGDPSRMIETVAVVGGAGDSEFDRVRAAGVDAYVTADLRHHPATEARAYDEGPALVDVAHWASEWPWLRDAERLLVKGLAEQGSTVDTHVSTLRTDAWNLRL